MLIVAGHVRLAPGEVEKILPAAHRMMEETHKEAGCREYTFARDLSDETTIRIFEIWESREALDAHFATPHMAEFNKALGDVKVESVSVKIYDVSGVHPLMGE
ncbi:MAG: putative quinol monooxygenase [Alphaproteobacteria bacterium]